MVAGGIDEKRARFVQLVGELRPGRRAVEQPLGAGVLRTRWCKVAAVTSSLVGGWRAGGDGRRPTSPAARSWSRTPRWTGTWARAPGAGIIIGADNVTLDLNGHQVFGSGQVGEGAGVLVSERSNVVVRNGTVRLFDAGVAIVGGSGNLVTEIVARDNIGVSEGASSQPGALYGDGIAVLSSSGNVIEGHTVVHNGPFSGIGVFELIDSDHPRTIGGDAHGNVVRNNVVLANNVWRTPSGPCDNDGIRLEPGVQFTTVEGN